jgi:uncharacterized phage protein gp47/JayE
MSADQTQALSTCGCCKAEGSPIPEPTQNRPGLSSIQYRMGTYASFLLAMMEEIAGAPELRNRLLTRSTDDFAIALLAMWSYVGDILTFYQERIANEAYLRTAVLQESVVQLAALLDYKPAPGAAAEADLAFFLDKNKQVQIPVGFRVQSVPGQNEKPQKFETLAAIIAYAALNQVQIFPQPQIYAPFAQQNTQAILLSDPKGLAPRTKLALFNALRAELKELSSLGLHNTQQVLTWKPVVQSADFQAFTTQMAVYSSEFRLFGYNAPSSYVKTKPDPSAPGKVSFELLTAPYTTDSNLPPPPFNEIALDARYNNLKAGGTVLIAQNGPATDSSLSFARLAKIANVSAQPAHYGPLDGSVTWLTLDFGVVGTPVVALDSSGQLNAFVIGDDGALWTIRQKASGGWDDWQSLGGNVDLLAVGTNQDGRLELFARGAKDKALWHIWQTSPSGDWSWWDSRGGRIDLLAVSRNQDGRLEVFARGMDDKALWHIWQVAPNNGWSGWASLGGEIDLLDVGINKDGRLEVFVRGTDKALWHIWQTAPNNGWSAWASLGGMIDQLTVGRNQDGRLEVFVRGMDLALWHIWQTAPNNGWSGWASLGGIIDVPTVGSNQDGRLEVFVRGTDKALWHIWQTAPNNGWSGWATEAGLIIEKLTVGSNQDGRLEMFVTSGVDQALWHDWQTAPNNGWSGWDSLNVPMWPITDEGRGRITVYEVVQLLEFSQFRYGDSISGATVYVPSANLPGIDKKRSIILDDAAANPETVMVQSAQQVDTDGDGQADHWLIAFTPDLTRALSTASATMFGNICTSSHGQTIAGEVLGDGDASQTFQAFRLQKSPVTFVHQAGAPHGVADSLQIQLAGVLWKETQDFFGHGPTERIFVTSQDAKGMTVQFGDGVTGSRLPTGRGNVVATYRQGIGIAGNVSAGALRTLLDRPVGLKSVSNPGPATGGADAETLDQTRGNAPNTVRTFGRIVSLEDFEDVAREVAGIAKAHAYSGWTGEEQVVYLTVAGIEGAAVIGNLYSDLVADLNSRRDPNRTMIVQSYTKIAVRFAATIFVSADHVVDDVLAAVQAAITGYFAFDNQQFGRPVHLSNVYGAIQGISGVTGVDITTLQYKKASDAISHEATSDAVQMHLRIDGAELAGLEDLIDDAVITAGAPV